MTHPERLVVGHPFNPVYLLPLVEVCPGTADQRRTPSHAPLTSTASLGMKPLVLQHEIDGFVADRLLEALWREALWLVNDGVATVEQVDDAIRFGAGLRWASMGTMLTYRIAGGEGGMRHFMAQFGPALQWPWSKLTDVPELTDELLDRIEQQSDAQAAGADVRELERLRDDCLVGVLQGLRRRDYAAGAVLKEYEQQLRPAGSAGARLVVSLLHARRAARPGRRGTARPCPPRCPRAGRATPPSPPGSSPTSRVVASRSRLASHDATHDSRANHVVARSPRAGTSG